MTPLTVQGRAVGGSGLTRLDGMAKRPAVVFVHGAGHDHSSWRLQRQPFESWGYHAIAPDLPGHGESVGPAGATITATADWLAELVQRLGRGRVHICGHSMGSLVALETAARHPDMVAGLVLLGTAAEMPVHPKLMAAAQAGDPLAIELIVDWSRPRLDRETTSPGATDRSPSDDDPNREMLERCRPDVLAADLSACATYLNGAAIAGTVSSPALVVAGSADRMTPAPQARLLAESLQDCRYVEVPNVGHSLMVDAPEIVNATIREFLDGVDLSGR